MTRILIILLTFSLVMPGAQAASQWEENLDVLVTELPQRHVDPFHHLSEAEFLAVAEALRAELPTLNDQTILMRMAALVGQLGDSHTMLLWQMDAPLYPLGLLVFEDGLYGVAALPDAADALGARLIRINHQPVEDVIAQVQTIIPHENETWLNAQLPNFIVRSEVLMGLGIIEQVEPILWEFETLTGESVILEVEPLAPADLNRSQLQSARSTFPRTEDTNGNYWLQLFDDGTLYFKYNAATEAQDLPFARFTEILLSTLEEESVERLVIDLRSNTGGNSTLLDPLITALQDHPINTPGSLFVIIGRRTYSSAALNAVRLAQTTDAVLVGEPTGSAPNHFGEVQRFDLPHFNLHVIYSTRFHEPLPGIEANSLVPDVPVEYSITDYLAGVDPFYAAVLAYPDVP